MVTRTISGVLGGLVVIFVLIFNNTLPFLLNVAISIICGFATYEIFSAMGLSKLVKVMVPSVAFSTLLPLLGNSVEWQVTWLLYTFFMFGVVLLTEKALSFKDVAAIYSMVLLITVSLNFIVKLRNFGGAFSSFYVLYALCISWMSDIGAYFFGTFFGKRKLCPAISPKKTVEGLVGGILFSLFVSVIICLLFERFMFDTGVRVNFHYIIPISLIGSLISIVGDLVFSVVKRGCHVKDFGSFIPGHGGFLDRFDSVIFVAPFVYFMVNFFNIMKF